MSWGGFILLLHNKVILTIYVIFSNRLQLPSCSLDHFKSYLDVSFDLNGKPMPNCTDIEMCATWKVDKGKCCGLCGARYCHDILDFPVLLMTPAHTKR